MAIIEPTEESKTWNLKAYRDSVSNLGGKVAWYLEDDDGKIWGWTHPALGESADGYRSEVMACDALCCALRDKLIEEFPLPRRAA